VTGVRIVRADAMGAFTSNPSYYVDDKADDRRFTVGFSPNMFDGFEWGALKTFCNKRGITQTHLNLMFRRWCTYPNAYLAAYRVRLDDIKEYYLHSGTPAIIMELVGLFFPPCLLREYQALNPAYSHEQFSFARFVINSVIFCALPMPDLICALFSTIKQTAKAKRYFPADTPIPTVTFQHVVKVTTVCFAPYAARLLTAPALLPLNCRVCPPWGLQLLMDNLHGSCVRRYILTVLRNNAPKSADEEITVETIVRLGMKYVRALLLPMSPLPSASCSSTPWCRPVPLRLICCRTCFLHLLLALARGRYPLLFYELHRFQLGLRKNLHGDTFWVGRPYFKSRVEGWSEKYAPPKVRYVVCVVC